MPDTFLKDYAFGWAQLIGDADVGPKWTPPPGEYAADDVGIGLWTFPTLCPKAVCLTPVPLSDDPTFTQSMIGLQVKSRAPERFDCMALDDAIFGLIQGLYPTTLPGGIRVVSIDSRTSTPLGQDEGDRFLWSSMYPVTAHRPTAHRT